MDTEPTIEAQLLAHAERQTSLGERQVTALEALRNFALIVLLLMGLGLVIGLAVAFG